MANVATLTAKMAFDVSDFQRGAGAVRSGLASVDKDAKSASVSVGQVTQELREFMKAMKETSAARLKVSAARDVNSILPPQATARVTQFGQVTSGINKDLFAMADQIRQKHETPFQKYTKEITSLNMALRGGLDWRSYGLEAAAARKRLMESSTVLAQLAPQTNRVAAGMGEFGRSLLAGIGFGSAYAGVMTILSTALHGVQRAASAAFGALRFGFEFAADIEQSTVAFKTMLGSLDEAKALVKDIENFALATPFDVRNTTEIVRLLKARNIATKELLPTMKTLGDISGGDIERLKHISLAYSQVLAKGKLKAQEVNQFAEAGVNLRPFVAKEMGVEIAALEKLQEDGKVSADVVRNALVEMANTQFGGAMEDQAKTARGALNRLQEVAALTAKDVAEGLGERFGITGGINELAAMAEVFRQDIAPDLVDGLAMIADELIDTLSEIEATFTRLERLGVVSPAMTMGMDGKTMFKLGLGTVSPGLSVMDSAGQMLDPVLPDNRPTFRDRINELRRRANEREEIRKHWGGQDGLGRVNSTTGIASAIGSALKTVLFTGVAGKLDNLLFEGGLKAGRGLDLLRGLIPKGGTAAKEFSPTGALEVGSKDAFSAIIRNMYRPQEKLDEKQLKALEAAGKTLDKILAEAIKAARAAGGVLSGFPG